MAEERKPDVAALAELIDELPAELRRRALTHSSWVDEAADSFERLAYLGDSVLALAVALELFGKFPRADAGGLTQIHNKAVSGVSCSEVGLLLGVGEMLREQEPEAGEGAAIPVDVLLDGRRPVPEATEALIGACFLAFGFERTSAAVAAAFAEQVEAAAEAPVDSKSALQELLAHRQARVTYEVIDRAGPVHRPKFTVAAIVDSKQVGVGEGRSKKEAELAAAGQALKRLDD